MKTYQGSRRNASRALEVGLLLTVVVCPVVVCCGGGRRVCGGNVQTRSCLFVADDEAFSHQPNLNLVEFSRLAITWCSTFCSYLDHLKRRVDDHDEDSYHRSRAGACDTSGVSQAIGMFFLNNFFFY